MNAHSDFTGCPVLSDACRMRTSPSLTVWLVAAGALAAPACGSSATKNCGQVQPCGGDVVGAWTLTWACPSAAAYTAQAAQSCPDSSVSSISQDVSGSLIFNADLTFRLENVSNTLATNNSFPRSCQAITACADLDRHQANTLQSIDTTCTGATTCTCESTVTTFGRTATGTYSTAGSALTLILDGVTTTLGYCVEGSRLHQITLVTGAPAAGGTTILNATVADRLTR
jgi:hypothetical protein